MMQLSVFSSHISMRDGIFFFSFNCLFFKYHIFYYIFFFCKQFQIKKKSTLSAACYFLWWAPSYYILSKVGCKFASRRISIIVDSPISNRTFCTNFHLIVLQSIYLPVNNIKAIRNSHYLYLLFCILFFWSSLAFSPNKIVARFEQKERQNKCFLHW